MNERLRAEIAQELTAREPRDEDSFFAWWGLAARLAVLGDTSVFATWQGRVKALNLDLEEALRRRAADGVEDLDTLDDHDLAAAVIAAQDAAFAVELSRDILPPQARLALEEWTSRVAYIDLDETAVAVLESWRDDHGFPEGRCLPSIESPVTGFERFLVASAAPPLVSIEEPWPGEAELDELRAELAKLKEEEA